MICPPTPYCLAQGSASWARLVNSLPGRSTGPGTRSDGWSWIFIALLLTVILAPLPLGSVYQWSWAGLAVVIGILLLIWVLRVAGEPGYAAFGLGRLWFPGLLFGLSLSWIAVQAWELTPRSWHHPIWAEAGETLGTETVGRVSLDPYDTSSSLLQMLTYGGVFWLAAQYCRARTRARAAVWALGIAGVGTRAHLARTPMGPRSGN